MCNMARGESGRVVVEVEPDLKSALYVALAADNTTLRAWFIREAGRYIERMGVVARVAAEPSGPSYAAGLRSESPTDDETI